MSDRQLVVLRRIGDGDDLSGPDGVAYRTSARSLQNRRLVEVSRRGGVWRATITDAGCFYLDHGHHPEDPAHRARPQASTRRPTTVRSDGAPSTSGTATRANSRTTAAEAAAAELIDRLQRDGTIRIEEPDDATRAGYRRAIHAAKQRGLVPEGFHLLHTGRSRGDLVIRLADDQHADDADWNRIRLEKSRQTTDPSRVLTALENDPENLHVTAASIPRALALVRLLADEASRRGHRLGVNTRRKHPKLFLRIGQAQRSVTLHEEYDEVPHVLTDEQQRVLRRDPWRTFPKVDRVASGRLRLEIGRAGWANRESWSDEKRRPLEQRIRQIIRDVENSFAADEEARLEAQRRHEEFLAEEARREAEERRQWEAALADARPQAQAALRGKTFRRAYDDWVAAGEIRAFCDALEQAHAHQRHAGHAGHASQWVAWGREAADRIDPTVGDDRLADVAFDIEPKPKELRPYLGGWNPHEPRKEYRTDADQQKLDAARLQAKSWHHGLAGRQAWWHKGR